MNISGYAMYNDEMNIVLERNDSYCKSLNDAVDRISYKYIGPSFCVFGVIGNIINSVVLSRQQLKESPYLYLKALALVDMTALIFSFPYMVFCIGSNVYSWRWYEIYVFLPFVNCFTAASVWLTVIMTIERFIFVKFPIWGRWKCNRFNAQVRVWAVMGTAIVLSVPRFFCYEIKEYENGAYIFETPFKKSLFYYGLDLFCIASLHFLPLLTLSIINIFLIYEVQRAKLVREELDLRSNRELQWQKDQRRFTVTLISIVVLSICSILPAAVSDILIYQNPTYCILRVLRNISNVLLWCNLSLNFILYCAFNKRFVRVLRDVIGTGFKKFRYSLKSTKYTDTTPL